MPDKVVQRSKIAEACALLAVTIAAGSAVSNFFITKTLTDNGDRARAAACANVASQRRALAESKAFELKVAKGERKPIPGITTADLHAGQRRITAYIEAVAPILGC